MTKISTLVSILSLLCVSEVVHGETWYVDLLASGSGNGQSWETAFKTIQDGIDAAAHGDTVLVAKETYVENAHFRGKNIVLQSADHSEAEGLQWYTIEVDFTPLSGEETRVYYTRAGADFDYHVAFRDGHCTLYMPALGDPWGSRVLRVVGPSLTYGRTYRAKIEVSYLGVYVSVNGDLLVGQTWANDVSLADGVVGLGASGVSRFDNLSVRVLSPSPRTMLFEGFDDGVADGFTELGGGWAVVDGQYEHSSEDPSAPYRSWVNARDLTEYAIIDGDQRGPVVTFAGTESETCVLSGFAIVNGKAPSHGGGICGGNGDDRTLATIRDNVIMDNSAQEQGGGIAFCDGTIENNTITGNSAVTGGGLVSCNGTIQNNTIRDNSAVTGILGTGVGGGLYLCDGTIENNVIRGNSATLGGGGLAACSGTTQNNTITGNSADKGGGLYACAGTIQNNTVKGNSAGYGGGLAHCGGTIENNMISENSADHYGGGLYESGNIQNNTVTGNLATLGGGLFGCDGTIENNVISENSADDYGGGIGFCNGIIQNNIITGNSARNDGGGLSACSGTTQNNTITGNSAGNDGGGLSACSHTIQNNTITGNSAGNDGGGLYNCPATITNNTITGNSADTGGGLYDCDRTQNCIIWGNTAASGPQLFESRAPTYSCIEGWTAGGEGNIAHDPLFVDAANDDYHLSGGSPCIDAGKIQYWMFDGIDRDGNRRIWNDRVDMGAYEHGSSPPLSAKLSIDERAPKKRNSVAIEITWKSKPGKTYHVGQKDNLQDPDWEVPAPEGIVVATGDTTTWRERTTAVQRFYKVVEAE